MRKFIELVVRFRVLVIISCLSLTVVFGYFVKDIKMDNDFLNYLSEDDPDVKFFKNIGKQFNSNYMSMIAIEADDIFSYPVLSRIRKITKTLENLDGIDRKSVV